MMKGLLHSKRFKTNLRKWLFMYVGVMVLLTSVITYSKYIASLQIGEDSARTSKFVFEIEPTNCPATEENICNTTIDNTGTTCRPTQEIASCFNVNTDGLEVDSELYLFFNPALMNGGYYMPNGEESQDSLFNITGIDVDGVTVYTPGNESNQTSDWKQETSSEAYLALKRTIKASKGANWTFRVRMKKNNNGNTIFSENINSSNLVKVGYSMSQITTKEGGN